ncbi:MAG: Dabb family protein [Alistipes sp.]|nr:Dabb family protein [Candidatus Alistipes equi]
MTHHVILWKLKEELSQEEKQQIKQQIKQGLESLQGKILGLLSIHVQIEGLPSSTADLMLNSTFDCEASLQGYSTNPLHVEVASTKVRPYTIGRYCLDYED